jgi:hypothetical protein
VKLYRIPIGGWKKCLHESAAFDGRGEYAAARILDRSRAVEWWLRNDPPLLRLPTPIGYFEPDFVYRAKSTDNQSVHGLLEIKAEIFWDGEGSDARVKSDAACRWIEAANSAASEGEKWEFAIVLDTDAIDTGSFEQLRKSALVAAP